MTDAREKGLNVFRELLPGCLPDGELNFGAGGYGSEIFESPSRTSSAGCGDVRVSVAATAAS